MNWNRFSFSFLGLGVTRAGHLAVITLWFGVRITKIGNRWGIKRLQTGGNVE